MPFNYWTTLIRGDSALCGRRDRPGTGNGLSHGALFASGWRDGDRRPYVFLYDLLLEIPVAAP